MKRFKICHISYIRKPKVAFSVFHFVLQYFFPNECPGLFRHRTGHSLGKKNGKINFGFSYIQNMANFEAFCRVISSSINLLFLKSDFRVLFVI